MNYSQALKNDRPHEFLFQLLYDGARHGTNGGAAGGAGAGAASGAGLLGFMVGLRTRVYAHFLKRLHEHCRHMHGYHEGGSSQGSGFFQCSKRNGRGGGGRRGFGHGHGYGRGSRGGRSHYRHDCSGFGYGNDRISPRFTFDYNRMNIRKMAAMKRLKFNAFAAKFFFTGLARSYSSYANMMGNPYSFFYTRNAHPFSTTPASWMQRSYWNSAVGRAVKYISIAPKVGLYELYRAHRDQYNVHETSQSSWVSRFRQSERSLLLSGVSSSHMGSGARAARSVRYENPSSMMKQMWFQQTRGTISSSNSYTTHLNRISPFEAVEETNRIIGGGINKYYSTNRDEFMNTGYEDLVETGPSILKPFESELHPPQTQSATQYQQRRQSRVELFSEEISSSVVLVGVPTATPAVEVTPFNTDDLIPDNLSPRSSVVERMERPHSPDESISPPTESSFVDFDVTPRFSLPLSGVDLTDDALLTIERDMELHLQEIRSIIVDIRRIANLGELPISIERNGNVIRVHFPNADSARVEQLLNDLEVSRGIIMDTVGPTHLLITPENSLASSASSESGRSLSTRNTFSSSSSGSPALSPQTTVSSSAQTPVSMPALTALDPSPAAGLSDEEFTWSYVGGSSNGDIPTPGLTESCGSTASSEESSSLLMSMRV
ncbi:hypothetical protein AWJ20_5282 [Sugiyamaella lignohabitans]|uniref:Uncharacterized protein n=1 Tax=Sugiyamaella lignohabitans TaxID=796027 RepID=A0A161HLM7_9ASCO|nr:uncharacterized protein AWJ20_5282 [Sugiyamaella lignohabitans]ANB14317.1 hypothetical protein AWJ20_5282 [Sugiyamaella lignohabitans]